MKLRQQKETFFTSTVGHVRARHKEVRVNSSINYSDSSSFTSHILHSQSAQTRCPHHEKTKRNYWKIPN